MTPTKEHEISPVVGWRIEDGYWWTPDCGQRFIAKGDSLFFEDGGVVPNDGRVMRLMSYEPGAFEDFSAWSDEKRAEVAEDWRQRREAATREREAHDAQRAILVASAEAKLTDDEKDALMEEYRY